MLSYYRIQEGKARQLKHFDPEDTYGIKNKEDIVKEYAGLESRLQELQDVLFASKTYGVLVVFQGMDCSGKDGVINKILSPLNPTA